MKKTLQDIAKETGYSVTTVSRAINGSAGVAPQARGIILNYARKIGYMQGKRTIALIVPSISVSLYLNEIMGTLCLLLEQADYRIEIIVQNSLELIEEHNICGAISIIFFNGLEQYWGKQQIIPLVCINTKPRHLDGIYTVASNEEQGTHQLTEHLIKLGHKKICILGSCGLEERGENYCHRIRCNTFKTVMDENGLQEYHGEPILWAGKDYIFQLKKAVDAGVTAFVCTIEGASARLVKYLNVLGKQVPEDISVTGWLDPVVDKYCSPAITGIMHNSDSISQHAVAMLNKLVHKEAVTDDIIIDFNFSYGDSTASLKK